MADDFDEDAVDDWSMRTWGQAAMEITHWSSVDGVHEVLLKYSNMVVILRLKASEDKVLETERQVAINGIPAQFKQTVFRMAPSSCVSGGRT